MGTTLQIKGIVMCHEYICNNCEHSFYYPIDAGTGSATDTPYIVICPVCGNDSCS